MPLVLNFKLGQSFTVGDDLYSVSDVVSENDVTIVRDSDGKLFNITDEMAVEVSPNVFISSGETAPTARLVIDAPRAIRIERLK